MENEDYMELVKKQIEHDKLLHSVKIENKGKAEKLFKQKQEILKKNTFLADFQLKRINKKINKLKNQQK